MAPSPEVFPGGSWERPWTAGEDGEELALPYEAGGAHATVEGEGELAIELDGEALEPLRGRAARALYDLAEHPRHESPRARPAALARPARLVGELRGRRALA